MSYPHYPPGTHAPATTATYPYGAYPTHHGAYGHPQAAGAYSYQAPGYQTGVTGYGWTYPYSYVQHPQAAALAQRPVTATTATTTPATSTITTTTQPQTTTASTHIPTATTTATPAPPRPTTTTFSSYTPTYSRDSIPNVAAGGRGIRKQSNLKGLFTKELRSLMYGFGDDRNPANDTVNVMEEILIEFIVDVCQTAGASSRRSRLSIEDLRRALSRPADAKKLARMEELLFMQEDIKRARAQFEESDLNAPKEF
ncbi:hypothetical protein AX16_003694 [Volvariella volvacea WC 439]|nr:hypothetical protein AX16_003694 [Volvariella volvacea WC 439]